jgi:hypothetical protein
MIPKYLIVAGAIAIGVSCNNQQESKTTDSSATQKSVLSCYRYINNKDTVMLTAASANGFLTGTLVYNFHEKDKNIGTIQGAIKDGILIADYSFLSEGTRTVRQVAFKKEGDTFIEGYGETIEHDGKIIFRHADSLDFKGPVILKAFDCQAHQ